ncbi:MAG TPA: hypothetical protein VFG15_03315 [Amycolatopsis sp.]|nr:hypothetical protein [Amycolatopsis sp.]
MYLNIDDIIPTLPLDFDNYMQCEEEVITPALLEAGYAVTGSWYTSEGDSFGPLSRAVEATNPDGEPVIVVYC